MVQKLLIYISTYKEKFLHTATEKANKLFQVLDNHPLEGIEGSFKISMGGFQKKRLLMGIQRKDITESILFNILYQLNMPNHFVQIFQSHLPLSNIILFGFEESTTHFYYKVYLEFWEKNKKLLEYSMQDKTKLLQYIGFKWDAIHLNQEYITMYDYYPRIYIAMILKRLEHLFSQTDLKKHSKTLIEIIQSMILYATQSIEKPEDKLIYLEANEHNNLRCSFDLNLYKANITLGDIEVYIYKLCRLFSISKTDVYHFINQIKSKPLGHISGGTDRHGKAFLTCYYELSF